LRGSVSKLAAGDQPEVARLLSPCLNISAHRSKGHRCITEYMEVHLGDAIRVRDFAQFMGMSRSHFNLAFRTTNGMPPYSWQWKARIYRAQELLLERALPLAEIALQTGFADQSHFTKSFTRLVGTSPVRQFVVEGLQFVTGTNHRGGGHGEIPIAASQDRPPIRSCERSSVVGDRMRELRSSGSVARW
jgi:AraC-like DNA-binding protein